MQGLTYSWAPKELFGPVRERIIDEVLADAPRAKSRPRSRSGRSSRIILGGEAGAVVIPAVDVGGEADVVHGDAARSVRGGDTGPS